MTYTEAPGWLETRYPLPTGGSRVRFHRRTDCPRIEHPETLCEVDMPYNGVRCALCAAEAGYRPTTR